MTALAPSQWADALADAEPATMLSRGIVRVWAVNLAPWLSAALPPWLTSIEHMRAGDLRNTLHRARWRTGRQFVRAALGSHLGLPPGEVELIVDARTGPRIPLDPVVFSISHSDDVLVLAVAAGQPVGVDVELRTRLVGAPGLADLSHSVLSDPERHGAQPGEAVSAIHLIATWVRKEAVAKALRLGLALPLSEVTVADGWARGPAVDDWRLRVSDLLPFPERVCAVAAHRTDLVRLRVV